MAKKTTNLDIDPGFIEGEDVERLKDKDVQKDLKKYKNTNFDSLIKQVQAEYHLAWLHQNPRIQENLNRLKLYNNQKRDKDLVGDQTMFTVFQTLLASFYTDKLNVNFEPFEEGDEETADNLNGLANFDRRLMKKELLDYYWIWDTLFFGRGLVMLREFDRSEQFMCPKPELWDPMTFLRDPEARSVNGDAWGNGGMRFGGREIALTKWQMKDNPNFFDISKIRKGESIKSLIEQARQAKNDASGNDNTLREVVNAPVSLYGNTRYHLLEWMTHWKGKKVLVVLSNGMQDINSYQELSSANKPWPLIDRPLYPTSHSWDGVSIPDLTEDKQRQRAVALNLGLNVMKSDLYPSYIYNEKAIKNPQDLEKMNQFNKMIPMKGDTVDVSRAIQPVNKATPNGQLLTFILDTLDVSAQKATATPELQQGQVSSKPRTLGELNLVASKVDTRYSLSAKIFGWSEKEFWEQWYRLYKTHFKDKIDEKSIRVNGAAKGKYRTLNRQNIICMVDPDIEIESQVVTEAKNINDRIMMIGFGNLILNDPQTNRRYFQRHLGRLSGMQKDQLDRLFPPTIDELNAEAENEMINEGKLPPIDANDDHQVHWEIHSKAQENPQKLAHMEAHREAMRIRRDQPELFPQAQALVAGQNPNANGEPVTRAETNDLFNNPGETAGTMLPQ